MLVVIEKSKSNKRHSQTLSPPPPVRDVVWDWRKSNRGANVGDNPPSYGMFSHKKNKHPCALPQCFKNTVFFFTTNVLIIQTPCCHCCHRKEKTCICFCKFNQVIQGGRNWVTRFLPATADCFIWQKLEFSPSQKVSVVLLSTHLSGIPGRCVHFA